MLKYVFITLLVAAVWAVVWWLELPLWIAIVVTALAVALIVTIIVVKTVRARRASREIEKALKAQADKQAHAARPDLEADIRALQGEFNRAVGALKSSRLGSRGAASALYSLPWYVIVGPPGVGKSTALRNSGLHFPFQSSKGGASVKGVGGTRNCEWWMTSEAVILDTAGRYTTEDSDREEWFAFLDLLKKYRTRRPINGVLAAVSVADLIEAHPDEVAGLAREIRARTDELQDRLGVVVPVYLVFTKCDLLPGFVEMFADLKEAERHQIWGFTLPAHDQMDLVGRFFEHYDELTAVLEKRVLRRVAEERRGEGRERIYELPQYLAALREPLGRFVHGMMAENIYHETPILRGVYLSSGTQEGRPLGRIMNAIAEGFGIQPQLARTAGPAVEAKSYFLGELFKKVIFPDYKLTRPNRTRVRRHKLLSGIAGATLLAASTAIMWLPARAFEDNRRFIREAGSAVANVEVHLAEDSVEVIEVGRIEPLRTVVATLAEYEADGAPWAMRMGMYQGQVIYPRLRDLYAATVRKEMLLPIVEREIAELERFTAKHAAADREASAEDYRLTFDRLRFYLLVSGPPAAGEPGLESSPDGDERKWLAAHVSDLWAKPMREAGDPATLSAIEAVAEAYLDLLQKQPELAFERDAKLVERVQKILKRSDRSKAVAQALIDAVDGPSLRLRDMVGVTSIRNQDRIIRPAFTRRGYEEQVKPRLAGNMDDLLDEQWVLGRGGEDGDKLRSEEIDAIKTEYFRRYIAEWRTFIDSTYIQATDDYVDALGLLSDLTRTEPYRDLFSHIAYHTQLVDLDAVGKADPDDALLSEVEKIAKRKLMQKAQLGRIGITNRVATAAGNSAAERVLGGDDETIVLTDLDVTYAFVGLAKFGARKPPPPSADPSAPPPPPEAVPLDAYLEQIAFVRDALQEQVDDPGEFEKLEGRLKAARSKVKSLLEGGDTEGWQPTLEKLLWPPIDLVAGLAKQGVAKGLSGKWCNEVVAEAERNLTKHYPFNPKGVDVALSEFTGFFHPESGDLWKFYESVLKNEVPLQGSRFRLAEKGAASTTKYRESLVSYLDAALEVTHVMFPSGAEDPKVEFEVLIQGAPTVKEIKLTLDGQVIRYRNGPEIWTSMTWPGEGTKGMSIEAVTGFGARSEVKRDGDWGLFRVLEEGTVRPSEDGRSFAVQWDFREENAGLVQMKFRPKRADTPFFGQGGGQRFMAMFRSKQLLVPRSIVVSGESCAAR
jgi:type VI secretion system protein ImpL